MTMSLRLHSKTLSQKTKQNRVSELQVKGVRGDKLVLQGESRMLIVQLWLPPQSSLVRCFHV